MKEHRYGLWLLAFVVSSWVAIRPVGAQSLQQLLGVVDLDELQGAITEMDVTRARELSDRYQKARLTAGQRHRLGVERTRLALYLGDCDAAQAVASGLDDDDPEVSGLLSVATRCARAVAGATVIEDAQRGLWIRLQDDADLPLVPFLFRVAERARTAVLRDLGVELPRPLRVDLVRDLFSLSAVSGLPLEAAETTGTVAVARWGRVTLLSPRAAYQGYPWEDTLAHELVHLGLSRATRDFAPLWLQEGVAKRQEIRWRPTRPFDELIAHDAMALNALRSGTSVGVDQLGQSIAMLDTANKASIAFAEVTSFINFWIKENGRGAFRLLLADLKGLKERDPNTALRSISGYSLSQWIVRWQHYLQKLPEPDADAKGHAVPRDDRLARRHRRLGQLLFGGHHFTAAAQHYDAAVVAAPDVPELRVGASLAQLALGAPKKALKALGTRSDIGRKEAGWFALRGRLAPEAETPDPLVNDTRMAISIDPVSELTACRGYLANAVGSEGTSAHPLSGLPLSVAAEWRALCEAARARPPIH